MLGGARDDAVWCGTHWISVGAAAGPSAGGGPQLAMNEAYKQQLAMSQAYGQQQQQMQQMVVGQTRDGQPLVFSVPTPPHAPDEPDPVLLLLGDNN